MLPRKQLCWGVLMATGIFTLWQNWNIGSSIHMSNALDLFPWQSALWLPCFWRELLVIIFDLMLFSTLINHSSSLTAEKQAFVNISMSLLILILSFASGSSKTRIVSRFNICFRGFLASVHGQQLQSLKASVKLLLVIHLHILSEINLDKTWDYNPLIMILSLKKWCINSTVLSFWCMKYKWSILIMTIFFNYFQSYFHEMAFQTHGVICPSSKS